MFRTLDRYLFKEILPYLLLGLFLLTAIIFTHEASRFSELFIAFSKRGVSSSPLLLFLSAFLPGILIFTLPTSVLFAILLGLGRMSADSEVVAIRASGIGRLRIIRPVLTIALAATTATGYITFEWLPSAAAEFQKIKDTRSQILLQGISTQVKPRVFIESFPGKVIYLQEIDRQTQEWERIFIANSGPESPTQHPTIITATRGRLNLGETIEKSEIHLYDGESHEISESGQQDDLVHFKEVYVGFASPDQKDSSQPAPEFSDLSNVEQARIMGMRALWTAYRTAPDAASRRSMLVELNKRLALPAACLLFAVLGVALGISASQRGRSYGLMLGILLMLCYYLIFASGEDAARSGALPAILGVWLANILSLVLGVVVLWRQRRLLPEGRLWTALHRGGEWIRSKFGYGPEGRTILGATLRRPRWWSALLPRLLDRLILKDLTVFFLSITFALSGIFMIFTLFELLGSIVRNRIAAHVVLGYFFFLSPQIIAYMTPLAILVAVLATVGIMAKSSQVTAMLASGNNIYRLSLPILVAGILASATLYAMQEYVLPVTNRQQDQLRSWIKAGQEPAQTFYQLDSRWIFGFGDTPRIYHYKHFDPERDRFASLSILELDPHSFAMTRRIYARRCVWDASSRDWILRNGWIKTFSGDRIGGTQTFEEIHISLPDSPGHFKRETKESNQLTTAELIQQIRSLSASGFDVLDLRIALYGKFSAPFTCLVMALVSIPFAFTVGKRGALFGVGLSIFIGLVYWGALGLFTQLGRYEFLPPLLAAWGPNMLFTAGGIYLLFTAKT